MRTREQYICVTIGNRCAGLQADTDEQIAADGAELREIMRSCPDRETFETAIKQTWPDRAYWIENWIEEDGAELRVQVVEYGAFEGKPNKRVIVDEIVDARADEIVDSLRSIDKALEDIRLDTASRR